MPSSLRRHLTPVLLLSLVALAPVPGPAAVRPAAAQAPAASADSAALLLRRGDEARAADGRERVLRALGLWRRGLAHARDGGTRAALHLRMGEGWRALGRPDSALPALRRALAEGGTAMEARVRVELARTHQAAGAPDSARAHAEAALAAMPSPPAPRLKGAARLALARALWVLERNGEAVAQARGAADLLEGEPGGAAEAALVLGTFARDGATPADAAPLLARALETARGAGDRRLEGWALYAMGTVHVRAGRGDSALAAGRLAAGRFAEAGDRRGKAATLLLRASARRAGGDTAGGRQGAAAAAALYRATGDVLGAAGALAEEAAALRMAGDADAAAGRLRAALARYRAAGAGGMAAWAMGTLGDVARDAGALDTALARYRSSLAARTRLGLLADAAWVRGDLADVHRRMGQPDSALAHLREARALYRRAGDAAGEATALRGMGDVWQGTGALDSARAVYAQAADASRRAGDAAGEGAALAGTAAAFLLAGRPDSARPYLPAAARALRAAGDARGEAAVRMMEGSAAAAVGDAPAALEHFRAAGSLSRSAGSPAGEAAALAALAQEHAGLWRADSARAYAARALALYRAGGQRRLEAVLLGGTLGKMHLRLDRPDSAAAYQRRALALFRAVGDRRGEAEALAALGEAHVHAERRDSARAAYEAARAGFRAAGDAEGEAGVLAALGTLRAAAEPDAALALLAEAVRAADALRLPAVRVAAAEGVGGAHLAAGRRDSAVAAFRAGAALAVATGSRGNAADLLVRAGDALRAAGDPAAAAAAYDTAAALDAAVIREAGADDDRVSSHERQAVLFGGWALAWLARADEVGAARAELAALGVAERGRARALLELMRRAGRLPDAAPSPGRDPAGEARALLRAVRGRAAAALVYLPAGDTLLVWLVPARGRAVLARVHAPADSLAAAVRAARAALGADEPRLRGGRPAPAMEDGTPAPPPAAGAGARLSALLLPDTLRRRLPAGGELLVVPGGVLGLVPFAALPLDDGTYLGARHALRYAPSLATAAEAERRPAAARGALGAALVVGNPTMPAVVTRTGEAVELDPLPGAEREAQGVARRLGAPLLRGGDAGEEAVAARLAAAPLVHLATHGYAYADAGRAGESFVALAPGGAGDGLLTVAEVLAGGPPLAAEVVVLSACQTGLGTLRRAEGTVGLQRAFLARGARSVMVSLWSVSDEATAALMEGFYAHWLDDADRPSKAEALRRAQADVRARPGFEPPLFWAAFQLVGAR